MIKTIILLIESPFNQRDFNRFGVPVFRARGFEVLIWDIHPITRPQVVGRYVPADAISDPGRAVFVKQSDIVKQIKQLDAPSTVIISYIGCGLNTYFIHRAINKKAIKVAICKLGSLPNVKMNRLKNMYYTYTLLRIITLVATRFLNQLLRIIIKPAKVTWFVTGGDVAYSTSKAITRHIKGPSVINVHSFDYDVFLDSGSINSEGDDDSYALFLDEYSPYHPDYLMSCLKRLVQAEQYYPALLSYFDYFEKKYGMPVKIAAHPRSDYSDKSGVFGQREIIYNNTAELVKSAKLVLLHSSTSLSYAVLYKIPVIFMSCSAYLKQAIYYTPSVMAGVLKTQAIVDICDASTYEVNQDIFSFNEEAYDLYKRDFIKSNGTLEMNTWNLFADEINKS